MGVLTDACILHTEPLRPADWSGGEQASLSAHGLEEGWGKVGAQSRRQLLRDCLTNPATRPEHIGATRPRLRRCAIAISLEELEGQDESVQDLLLRAASSASLGQAVLMWRSVLRAFGPSATDRSELAARK